MYLDNDKKAVSFGSIARAIGGAGALMFFAAQSWAAEGEGAADAAAGAPQGGSLTGTLMMIVPIILIFYFMLIRPQKKRQQQHDAMLRAITRGDTVITAGGFYGEVCDILGDSYILELAEGMKVRILKSSVMAKVDKTDPSTHSQGGDRPRRKKKRRPRPVEEGAPESTQDEGVTEAENDALIADPVESDDDQEKREA